MPTLLRIDCSPRGAQAHSWQMADELIARLASQRADLHVLHRNLAATPSPLVDLAFASHMGSHTTAESARTVPALTTSEHLIGELEASHVLVIATPMHNFMVPAVLKAWIDQVARVGRTFRSTPEGKIGTLADRPTFLVVSSGGYHSGEQARQPDFLTPYLRAILGTMGIHSVTVIRMQGLTRGDEPLARARALAQDQIAKLELGPLPA